MCISPKATWTSRSSDIAPRWWPSSSHHNIPASKYHETLTRAWILAVHHFMHRSPDAASADDFIERNPLLLDSKIMLTHYSAGLLFSEPRARSSSSRTWTRSRVTPRNTSAIPGLPA